MDATTYRELAQELESRLRSKTSPLAISFLADESCVPEGAIKPTRDLGKRGAFCQALGMARMKRIAMVMAKEDHWCWNPLVAFGLVEGSVGTPGGEIITRNLLGITDDSVAEAFWADFPMLEQGAFRFTLVEPAAQASHVPDVTLVYCDTEQILALIGAVKSITGRYVESRFDSIDSCVHSIVEPLQKDGYQITFPDPGERARGNARESEVIFSIPTSKMEELIEGMRATAGMYMHSLEELGFQWECEVPPPYHQLFKLWGIEGEDEEFQDLGLNFRKLED